LLRRKLLPSLFRNLLRKLKLVMLLKKVQLKRERVAKDVVRIVTDPTSQKVMDRDADLQERVVKLDAETDLKAREDSTNPSTKRRSLKATELREATAFPHHLQRRSVSSRRTRSKSWKMKVLRSLASPNQSPKISMNHKNTTIVNMARNTTTTVDLKTPD